MKSLHMKILAVTLVVVLLVADCESRKRSKSSREERRKNARLEKMLVLQRRETSPVDFSRLVAMRLIYGFASMFGVQDRLGGVLNGIFVPPGADEDDYGGFGGFGDDDDGEVDLGDYFDP